MHDGQQRFQFGALFVRGVGDEGPNASLDDWETFVEKQGLEHPFTHKRQVNWQQSDKVKRPFLGSPNLGEFIDVIFFKELSSALLKAANTHLGPKSNDGGFSQWFRMSAIGAAKFLRIAGLFWGLLFFGWLRESPDLVLLGVAGIAIPSAIALLCAASKFDLTFFLSIFRCLFLHVVWPILFVVFALPIHVSRKPWILLLILPVILTHGCKRADTSKELSLSEIGAREFKSYENLERFGKKSFLYISENDTPKGQLKRAIITFKVGGGMLLLALASWYILSLLLYRFLFRHILKIMADILRYIGDDTYRFSLMDDFESSLQELASEGCKRIAIVSHSLGTVIAIDALLRMQRPFPRNVHINIFTLGSPLRRFFWRFFGYGYPPPLTAIQELKQKYSELQWFNIYRPLDFVGASLKIKEEGYDLSTEQLLKNHSNYWTDLRVVSMFLERLKLSPKAKTKTPEINQQKSLLTRPHFIGRTTEHPHWRTLSYITLVGVVGVFVVAALVSGWNDIDWPNSSRNKELIESLRSEGKTVTAKLYRWSTLQIPQDLPPYEIERNIVGFPLNEKGIPKRLYDIDSVDWLNTTKLSQWAGAYDESESKLVPGSKSLYAHETPVQVTFHKNHPNLFTIKHAEQTIGAWDWFITTVLKLCSALGFAALALVFWRLVAHEEAAEYFFLGHESTLSDQGRVACILVTIIGLLLVFVSVAFR